MALIVALFVGWVVSLGSGAGSDGLPDSSWSKNQVKVPGWHHHKK